MKATIIRPTNIFLLDKTESDSKGKQGVAKSADRTDGPSVVKGWKKEWFMMDFISIAHRCIDFSNLDRRQAKAKQMKFN